MSSCDRTGGAPSRGAGALPRRRTVRLLAGVALAGAGGGVLHGCGFHLRGDVAYPFSTLYINSPSATPLATELRRTLEGSGTKLVARADEGQVVLDILAVADDKQVLSLSGGGRAREYLLTKRVSISLHDAHGRDWMPSAEIVVRRTFTFNEAEVLAREHEETRLLKEMQSDVVRQILRRLQSAKNPVA